MSMYHMFKTDAGLEKNGIIIDYGAFRVTIGRAGGANKRFVKTLDRIAKPYRRAIQTETMDNERGMELLREAYAEAVVLKWETMVDGEWREGIEAPDGSLMPVSKENVMATFKALPDLFTDLQEQAGKATLFRQAAQEAEAGN